MPNISTNLKTWGSQGEEYPDNYNYVEGEQPVDAWDNFLNSEAISVVDDLITAVNTEVLALDGSTSMAASLDLGGNNLESSGTVIWDGPNAQIPQGRLENSSLSVATGDGLSNGGSVSLGGSRTLSLDESYSATWTTAQTFQSSVTIGGNVDTSGEITVDDAYRFVPGAGAIIGYTAGVRIWSNFNSTNDPALWVGKNGSVNIESGNMDVEGNITLTGTVDGVDVSSLKSNFDTHENSTSVHGASGNVLGGNDVATVATSGSYADLTNRSHDNTDHVNEYVSDGDGTTRQIWVIANGASDPSGASADDIIFEREA